MSKIGSKTVKIVKIGWNRIKSRFYHRLNEFARRRTKFSVAATCHPPIGLNRSKAIYLVTVTHRISLPPHQKKKRFYLATQPREIYIYINFLHRWSVQLFLETRIILFETAHYTQGLSFFSSKLMKLPRQM
jgi:hypothetical protein